MGSILTLLPLKASALRLREFLFATLTFGLLIWENSIQQFCKSCFLWSSSPLGVPGLTNMFFQMSQRIYLANQLFHIYDFLLNNSLFHWH